MQYGVTPMKKFLKTELGFACFYVSLPFIAILSINSIMLVSNITNPINTDDEIIVIKKSNCLIKIKGETKTIVCVE
jgi:hypothetical protein